jgi:hypothetical protein
MNKERRAYKGTARLLPGCDPEHHLCSAAFLGASKEEKSELRDSRRLTQVFRQGMLKIGPTII